jgi:hypothetical protein
MVRHWGLTGVVLGHSTYYWIAKNAAVTILASLAFGFAGASTACMFRRFRGSALRHS